MKKYLKWLDLNEFYCYLLMKTSYCKLKTEYQFSGNDTGSMDSVHYTLLALHEIYIVKPEILGLNERRNGTGILSKNNTMEEMLCLMIFYTQ